MRIIMLGKWPEKSQYGGVATHVVGLVGALGRLTDSSLQFLSFGKENGIENNGTAKIKLMRISIVYYLLPFVALIKLASEVRKFKPEIIHLEGSNLSPYLLYVLLMNHDRKLIVTFHNSQPAEQIAYGKIRKGGIIYKILNWLEIKILSRTDIVICVTEQLKAGLINEQGDQISGKIVVLPNGVDCTTFSPRKINTELRKALKIQEDSFVILSAKALEFFNGQEYLINAMPEILENIPTARLVIAGEGSQKNLLRHRCSELGIDDKVIFVGRINHDDMPDLIAMSNLVVIPSLKIAEFEEGSSILMIEAMAMGKPVIASDIGGLKETITNYMTGILIPDKKPEIISRKVIDLFESEDLCESLGKKAREFIENERSWDRIATKTHSIYMRLLDK